MKELSKYDRAAAYLRVAHGTFAEAGGVDTLEGVWITCWNADNDHATEYRMHEDDVDTYAAGYDDIIEDIEERDEAFRKKWKL